MTELRATRFSAVAARVRAVRPPRWWQEIAFIAIVYFLYSLVRNAVPSHEAGAFDRARWILSFEHSWGFDIERWLNHVVDHHAWLAYVCNYYYSTLHFVVTIGVLIWLYVKHPLRYRAIRSVLLFTNLVALIGFWLVSVAPPRMLSGYFDTVIDFQTWGSLASPGLAKASNQFAAMPSLHIGWSLWCGIAIVVLARRPWVRVLGALYPLATLFVIVGTANHYILDAVGGVATLLAAVAIQRLISGRSTYRNTTIVLPEPAPEPTLVSV
ncbi:MAG: phosphatase PAP2 family protein [Frankiaceae bacterium]|nr:phosphatase PAP2 family protein [Frankiaceae bacterium]